MTSPAARLSARPLGFLFDPASLAGLWANLSLLGTAASLLLGGAALFC